jgi:transcriptional regulator with XRE-family HTH domain
MTQRGLKIVSLLHKQEKLVRKLTNKDYRDAWVEESVKMVVPHQIQAIRNKKDWSQEQLGNETGMLRNAISRLESVEYGNLSVNTLLRIAHGFDCGLLVKFVPFSRMVAEFDDVSPKGLEVTSFDDDVALRKESADHTNTKLPHYPKTL